MEIVLFNYQQLDSETRIVVQQEDKEFDRNIGEANQSFVHACKNLPRIHDALRYKRPGFDDYCQSKPGLSRATAYKMLNVAKMCLDSGHISIESKEALYLLAAPSTPEPARQEAVGRAEAGERITHQAAKEIVNGHKVEQENGLDALRQRTTERQEQWWSRDEPEQSESNGRQMKPKSNQIGDIYTPKGYDACQTPPEALDPLLPYIDPDWTVWEPAAGEGYLEGALYDSGFSVIPGDLLRGENFFDYEPPTFDCLITNPPYSIKYDWLKRCYGLGKPFALLLPVETLGAESGAALFREYGLEIIFITPRINFKMPTTGWEGSSAQFPTAWFTWQFNIGQGMTWIKQ